MNNLTIKGTQEFMGMELPNIYGGFGKDQKVILAKTIAEIHELRLDKINSLINNNLEEFEEGIDILDLKNSTHTKVSLLELGFTKQTIANSKNIYLLSEQGYMALATLMRTDKAKEIRKYLRREYFAMKEIIKSDEQRKSELLVGIFNRGGIESIHLVKELTIIESKEAVKEIKNGEDKLITVTEVVKLLNIEGLNTRLFHTTLAQKGYGTYSKIGMDKKRTFQPSISFIEKFVLEGGCLTGNIANGSKKNIIYTIGMMELMYEDADLMNSFRRAVEII